MSLAYLAAAAPSPEHKALVARLSFLGAEAENIVTALESAVTRSATDGATKAVKPFVYGMAAMLVVGMVINR